MHTKATALFISLLAVFATLVVVSASIEITFVQTRNFKIIADGEPLGVLEVKPKNGEVKGVIAVMIPGLLEPKEAYKSIAIELCKLGIRAYAVDLVGHGLSNEPFRLGEYSGLEEAIDSLIIKYTSLYEKVVEKLMMLSGASSAIVIGQGVGGSIAISIGGRIKNVQTVIAMSPEKVTQSVLNSVNSSVPRCLLVIVGSLDPKDKIENAKAILRRAGVINVMANKVYGNPKGGIARKLAVVDLSVGFLNYYHGGVVEEVVKWVSDTLGLARRTIFPEVYRLYIILASLLIAIASITVAPAAIAPALNIFCGGKRWAKWEDYRKALILALKWYALSFLYIPVVIGLFLALGRYIALPAYMYILVAYDIVAVVISAKMISSLTRKRIRDVLLEIFYEPFRDVQNMKLGLLQTALQLGLFLSVLVDVAISLSYFLKPEFLIAVAILIPAQIYMNLAYEMFFRRYVQEALGGVTFKAVVITVGISATVRLLIMLAFVVILSYAFRTPGFGLLLFALLFFVQVAIEGVSAVTYKYTREISPAAIANSTWALFALALSPLVAL